MKKKKQKSPDKESLKLIEKEMKKIKKGDLYYALHHVGDDPVKSEIDKMLEEMLDDSTFRKVVAIFNLSTGWRNM